jgi:Protein of unknown function (DUF1573)
MNWQYSILIAFGAVWVSGPASAQVTDSTVIMPAPVEPVRSATPPRRGAKPTMGIPPDNTANAGKVEWSERIVDFGTFGFATAPVKRTVTVKNLHTEPLSLLEIKTSCHCAAVEFSSDPIAPGQSGQIIVTYTPDEPNEFYRVVTIRTSFDVNNWFHMPVVGTATAP